MSGPLPKHPSTRARRNSKTAGFTALPSEGREGPTPGWPLGPDIEALAQKRVADSLVADLEVAMANESDGRKRRTITGQLNKARVAAEMWGIRLEVQTEAELRLWAELWTTPQAVEWERSHSFRAVAMFVRLEIRGESGDMESMKEALKYSDRTGMNPWALQRLRQEVDRGDEADERSQKRRQASKPATKPDKGEDDPRGGLYAVG